LSFGENLPSRKSAEEKETGQQEKKEIAVSEKKGIATAKPERRTTALAPRTSPSLWRDFDRVFDRFRRDFEDLLWPTERSLAREFSLMPTVETRVPYVDLEDRGKDFLVKAEMPGFKKEDVEIQVKDDSVEIRGTAGWKYNDKTKNYICRERECESFYRMIGLPEEVKTGAVEANLKDGILEITLPKKAPKQKKKVAVK
jgi:HSP20 family protein